MALLQATSARASWAMTGRLRAAAGVNASTASSPVDVATATARMRFSVRVPVLSVQITVVEPSVSTADRRFTIAPRLARIRTPAASASVMVGRRPSGTFATRSPTAKMAACGNESPAANMPSGRKAAPTANATRAITQAIRRTWRSSGLCSTSWHVDKAAIRPSSVCMPVAWTTAVASPPRQVVPLKSRSGACRYGTARSERFADRSTASDSPVSMEASTSTDPVSIRASAEMRSPSATIRTSPGTRPAAATRWTDPSRRTVACVRQIGAKGLDGPFGLLLLQEGESGVDQDDDQDGDGQDDRTGPDGQHRGQQQQQGQGVGELMGRASASAPDRTCSSSWFGP